jgi:hypothetical protein
VLAVLLQVRIANRPLGALASLSVTRFENKSRPRIPPNQNTYEPATLPGKPFPIQRALL